jgi:membrane protein implicated in regulation of membrane protease activity
MEVIAWLIALIAFLVIEGVTVTLVCIWFAGGALIGMLAAALHAPIWLQVLLFLLVSIILLVYTRPIAMKYFNKNREKTNVSGVIGKQAIVVDEIDNLQGLGKVTVGGQEWTARSMVEDQIIPVGTVVVVEEVKGVKLMVRSTPKVVEVAEES